MECDLLSQLLPTRCLEFHGKTYRVLLQDQRFQSCLIGTVNVLILKGELSLTGVPSSPVTVASSTSRISDSVALSDVVTLAHNYLLDHCPSDAVHHEDEDTSALLVNLAKHVDVHYNLRNVQELLRSSPELALLKRFGIPLLHAMKVSVEDGEQLNAEIEQLSFQELCDAVQAENVERIQHDEGVNSSGEATVDRCSAGYSGKKPHFKAWWEKHRGEVTFEGIADLHKALRNEEIVLFHRQNHFALLTKQRESLFTLVTDVDVVESMPHSPWQTLADVEGCETDFANEIFIVHDESAPSPQRFQQPFASAPPSGGPFMDEDDDEPPPPPRRNSQLVKRGEAGATSIMLNKEVISGREFRRTSLQATPESSPQRFPSSAGQPEASVSLGPSQASARATTANNNNNNNNNSDSQASNTATPPDSKPTTSTATTTTNTKTEKSSCCVVM